MTKGDVVTVVTGFQVVQDPRAGRAMLVLFSRDEASKPYLLEPDIADEIAAAISSRPGKRG